MWRPAFRRTMRTWRSARSTPGHGDHTLRGPFHDSPADATRSRCPAGAPLHLGARTLVMGILNVTPDSFADGGVHFDAERAVDDGLRMVEDGADISTSAANRRGRARSRCRQARSCGACCRSSSGSRARPRARSPSTPTRRSVAREAVARGADDRQRHQRAAVRSAIWRRSSPRRGAALVLMHTRGRSSEMYREAVYEDVAAEVAAELEEAIARATRAGVSRGTSIILDPGLGFAKRAEHSYEALAHLDALAALDRPILSGPSRKSFLKAAIGDERARRRASGAPPRPSRPACCSARTSSACTACARWSTSSASRTASAGAPLRARRVPTSVGDLHTFALANLRRLRPSSV